MHGINVGREARPRWPRDSQIISFHPLRGQASIRLTRNSPTPSPTPYPPPPTPLSTDRDGSPTKNNLESTQARIFPTRWIHAQTLGARSLFFFFFFRREEERWVDLERKRSGRNRRRFRNRCVYRSLN